ncbi:hypothetical protein M9H77_02612 [Catharanthus roseus]|uniref:Uncharacterized protein n=1 Tax=Catharanthus roseus TaxID=4058 RepID=A0ACC0C923_CATRO|nr:hypothetical protein M9H77_02612 [Catharanthus roseus]
MSREEVLDDDGEEEGELFNKFEKFSFLLVQIGGFLSVKLLLFSFFVALPIRFLSVSLRSLSNGYCKNQKLENGGEIYSILQKKVPSMVSKPPYIKDGLNSCFVIRGHSGKHKDKFYFSWSKENIGEGRASLEATAVERISIKNLKMGLLWQFGIDFQILYVV